MNELNAALGGNPIFPLVGMHFRPPAKQVIGALPNGTDLYLEPEPDNPYDALAIKVFVDLAGIPEMYRDGLVRALEGTGFEFDELVLGPLHLGYIGRSGAKQNVKLGLGGNAEVHAMAQAQGCAVSDLVGRLTCAPQGDPCVEIEDGRGAESVENI